VTSTPDDDRLVELDDPTQDDVPTTADDPETRDAELHAETPLALDDEELRGDDPPDGLTP
jgi:hypothetical protein